MTESIGETPIVGAPQPADPAVWFPLLEANQGSLSLLATLISLFALIAAFFVAWIEFQRAKQAQAARVLEPAHAALEILDGIIGKTKEGIASEGGAHEAVKYALRWLEPFEQIARGPTQPDLILALHDAVAAIKRFKESSHIAFEDDDVRRKALEHRVALLQKPRTEIASIFRACGGIIRS